MKIQVLPKNLYCSLCPTKQTNSREQFYHSKADWKYVINNNPLKNDAS